MKTRKRPELVTLPTVPTILKVSEIPSNVFIMKINLPVFLRHLARADVNKLFIVCQSNKSIKTIAGEDVEILDEARLEVTERIREKYPVLNKHLGISFQCKISFGSWSQHRYHYISDLKKFMADIELCGFSELTLKAFLIYLAKPGVWSSFVRRDDVKGFIATQFGNKVYDSFKLEDLQKLIMENDVLIKLNAFICETAVATGKWLTCAIPSKE